MQDGLKVVVMLKENERRQPWQEIAEALIKERDPEKAFQLADELDRAIEKKLNRGSLGVLTFSGS